MNFRAIVTAISLLLVRNGSGKTTTLKTINGSGALYFNPSYRVCWPWESELNKEDISDGECHQEMPRLVTQQHARDAT
ncbi:hypothetical protein OK016_17310 [Vibrio chagasii]|nr:hypothetical protein [Vibrio chagasii]